MRKIGIPLLLALLLLVGSGLALTIVDAAPRLQTTTRTPTPRTSPTTRSTGTATPRSTGTTPTARSTGTATPRASASATASPLATTVAITDTEATTDTTETVTDTATLTETVIITGSILPPELSILAEDVDNARTLTVIGLGQINEVPDVASISLGVETTGSDPADAAAENNAIVADILAAIEELDIPARNIQTGNYSIFIDRSAPIPLLEGPTSSTVATDTTTYHVSQQINVRIENLADNLDRISNLIEAAVDAGANNIFGPSFELSNDRTLQQRARRAAVEDAYTRAQDWATLTGVELIGVVSVSEVIGGSGSPGPLRESAQASGAGPSIQPGTLGYTEQVQVVFYIR